MRYDEKAECTFEKSEVLALYTEQDFSHIKNQKKNRLLLLWLPVLPLLAALIYSLVIRQEWLTVALTILTGCYLLFTHGLLVAPVIAYYQHMDQVMHGRTRTITGAFKEMDETPVLREGVRYYAMLLNVGRMEEEEDDRLFYYDANLPRPDWQKGDQLTLTYHDKAVGAWKKA